MNSILKKIRQSDAFNEENRIPYTKAIVLMSLFTFVFLGAEFLFVNMISRMVSGNQSVNAQNYALGISVIGFVLYPVFSRFCKGKWQTALAMCAAILSVICLFMICRHASYALTLGMGLLLFLILGAFGSVVFYKTLCLLEDNTYIARLTPPPQGEAFPTLTITIIDSDRYNLCLSQKNSGSILNFFNSLVIKF